MIKKILILCTISGILPMIFGCATIMRDNTEPVTLNASPTNVDIKIVDKNGLTVFEGQTPTTINLKTSTGGYFNPQHYTIYARKDGYADYQTRIDYHISGWYWANIIFGGLIGMLIIDPISGDMYYLEQDDPIINMTPSEKE